MAGPWKTLLEQLSKAASKPAKPKLTDKPPEKALTMKDPNIARAAKLLKKKGLLPSVATTTAASTLTPQEAQAHPLDKLLKTVRPQLDDILAKTPNVLTTPTGEPRILLHGTSAPPFKNFDPTVQDRYDFTSFATDPDFVNNWLDEISIYLDGRLTDQSRIIPGLGRGPIFDYKSKEDLEYLDSLYPGQIDLPAFRAGDWEEIERLEPTLRDLSPKRTGFNVNEEDYETINLFDANKDFFPLFDLDKSKGSSN